MNILLTRKTHFFDIFRTCRLEALSRSLLIGTLDAGSKAQNLLRADRNVQRRFAASTFDFDLPFEIPSDIVFWVY